jgi:SRSO17 transposase
MGEREIVLVIDDTGDRKKGQHTDHEKLLDAFE